MQEVLMLVAGAILMMSVYKTATLDDSTAAHLTGALAAQGVTDEAAATARGLLLDALGPGGAETVRGYKCLTFEVKVLPPGADTCRRFHLAVDGSIEAAIDGTLCPQPDGRWGETGASRPVTSTTLDQRWRDVTIKTGTRLYNEPRLQSYRSTFDWPDTRVQVGGYSYHDALTFALIRLPSGDTHYVFKTDLAMPAGAAKH